MHYNKHKISHRLWATLRWGTLGWSNVKYETIEKWAGRDKCAFQYCLSLAHFNKCNLKTEYKCALKQAHCQQRQRPATWLGFIYLSFTSFWDTPSTKVKWQVANRWLTPFVLSEMISDTRNLPQSKHCVCCVFVALLTFSVGLSWSSAPSLALVASIFIRGDVWTTTSCSVLFQELTQI